MTLIEDKLPTGTKPDWNTSSLHINKNIKPKVNNIHICIGYCSSPHPQERPKKCHCSLHAWAAVQMQPEPLRGNFSASSSRQIIHQSCSAAQQTSFQKDLLSQGNKIWHIIYQGSYKLSEFFQLNTIHSDASNVFRIFSVH